MRWPGRRDGAIALPRQGQWRLAAAYARSDRRTGADWRRGRGSASCAPAWCSTAQDPRSHASSARGERERSRRSPLRRCLGGTRRSWRGASAPAVAVSAAARSLHAAAPQHAHGGAGAGLRAGARRPRARRDEAPGGRRWPTRRVRVGPAITQNNGPTGSVTRSATHDSRAAQPHASIPTTRRRSFFPCLTKIDPRRSSRSVSVSDSASLIRSPARQSTTISPFRRLPYRAFRATRMIAMISSTVGGSAA
jgi:hypothetical protein